MKAIMTTLTLLVGLSLVSCQHGYKDHKGHDHKGHDHKGHDHKNHEGHAHKGHDKHKMWDMMDTNKDGVVSKAEFDKMHQDKFKKMDANNDGKITKEEKKAYKDAKKAEMKDGGGACCS